MTWTSLRPFGPVNCVAITPPNAARIAVDAVPMQTLSARARSRSNSTSTCGESCGREVVTSIAPGVFEQALQDLLRAYGSDRRRRSSLTTSSIGC